MKADDLRCALSAIFSSKELEMPGWVNYSGLDVLKEQTGGFYLFGINPGEDDSNRPLSEYIPEQSSSWSAFTDVCWKKHQTSVGKCKHIALVSHQIQVLELARVLGISISSIFATNAIFFATRGVEELSKQFDVTVLWTKCWQVHQRFLAEMQPRMIICLGYGYRSAFDLLREMAGTRGKWLEISNTENSPQPWKAGDAELALFEGAKLSVRIVGLPHPSTPDAKYGRLADNFRSYLAANP